MLVLVNLCSINREKRFYDDHNVLNSALVPGRGDDTNAPKQVPELVWEPKVTYLVPKHPKPELTRDMNL